MCLLIRAKGFDGGKFRRREGDRVSGTGSVRLRIQDEQRKLSVIAQVRFGEPAAPGILFHWLRLQVALKHSRKGVAYQQQGRGH